MKKILNVIDHLSMYGVAIAGFSLVLMLIIEFLNVLGRELYVPLPCALEASESLLVVCIYLGVAYVNLHWQHTNVTILTMRFSFRAQKYLDSFAYLFGVVIYSILALGAWRTAIAQTGLLEMRIGVFRFPIWPFRILFAVGLTLLVLQSLSNAIKCILQAQVSNGVTNLREGDMYYG
jgi:TRAP-type C4-dicarboxylate transport system permease small subunit